MTLSAGDPFPKGISTQEFTVSVRARWTGGFFGGVLKVGVTQDGKSMKISVRVSPAQGDLHALLISVFLRDLLNFWQMQCFYEGPHDISHLSLAGKE